MNSKPIVLALCLAWCHAWAEPPDQIPFPSEALLALRRISVKGSMNPVLPAEGRERLLEFKTGVQTWALGQLASQSTTMNDNERVEALRKAWGQEAKAQRKDAPETSGMAKGDERFSGEVSARFSVPKGHRGLLLLEATVGYHCGDDATVLLLARKKDGSWSAWSAFKDVPQEVSEGFGELRTLVGPSNADGSFSLVVGWYTPWFTSTWRSIHLDCARLSMSNGELYLEARHQTQSGIWIGEDPPFEIALEGTNGFTARFLDMSMDPGRHSFRRSFHYRLEGDDLRRIPPFGENAVDFLEEWFKLPWDKARTMVSPGQRNALWAYWKEVRQGQVFGTFKVQADSIRARRSQEGWCVDFEAWGKDGDGPPVTFVVAEPAMGAYVLKGKRSPRLRRQLQARRSRCAGPRPPPRP